jgi:hypothetical protein
LPLPGVHERISVAFSIFPQKKELAENPSALFVFEGRSDCNAAVRGGFFSDPHDPLVEIGFYWLNFELASRLRLTPNSAACMASF